MLKLFNTRTNRIDTINITDNYIGVYTCGPTVYDRVHIGNLKTIFWSDFFVSFLEHLYPNKVHAIINITDIDDKIISRLKKQTNDDLIKYTTYYTNKFLNDLNSLKISRYNNNHHKVTDNLDEVKKMISKLQLDGFTYYDSQGSIYFDSSKIKEYPFPSIKKEDIKDYDNERDIIRDKLIKDNKDFALWKCKNNEEIFWEYQDVKNIPNAIEVMPKNSLFSCNDFDSNPTSISRGRPGWHIECSAIANKHLENVTFHLGGEDLKFPHHTCEIIQSESYNPSKVFGKYWLHIGFLNVNGEKMSKSIGNILKLDDINVNKNLLRYYLFHKQYRKQNDFNIEELNSYKIPFLNIHKLYNKLNIGIHEYSETMSNKNLNIYDDMIKMISNDLDTKGALGILNKYVNIWLKSNVSEIESKIILKELDKVNELFKIIDDEILFVPKQIMEIMNERNQCKIDKNFQIGDRLREFVIDSGYIYEDNINSSIIIKNI
jgi:cysteinyl-tRNA synthetase